MVLNHSKNPALAAAMARTGKTGLALSRESEIHPVTFSHLLNNRSWPKAQTIRRIAKALHTTPKALGFPKGGGK